MKIEFTKMHGLGNDFILIDCRETKIPNLSKLSERLCDRRFGIGADQLLTLYPSRVADFRMGIFNADGSEVEMCGNGIRCLAKYIWDRGLSEKRAIQVETLAGIIRPERVNGLIRVDMGEPILEPEKIPVDIRQRSAVSSQQLAGQPRAKNSKFVMDYPLQIGDREFRVTCVSMGNPHAVIVTDSLSEFPVAYYGPAIEHHPLFPKRTNVEFIEVLNRSEIRMKVWERGAGETMACGTGACAAAVAAHLQGLTERSVTTHLGGGDLFIDWDKDAHVYMTGPAAEVFTGTINLDSLG
ncbi:MAG TPA: diaminopimelate epimerase [Thermodesulfovibrionales bacterium]|nr:diaminopimelate epimerase [Thermodesulfovibrionales bacterium]